MPETTTAPSVPAQDSPATQPQRFQRDLCRMILVFFAVGLVDLVVISLLSGKLRFWFPVWIDPDWATRPDAWVVYSQSYLAGVFFIPLAAWSADRHLLCNKDASLRAGLWVFVLGLLGFIGWWKGGLMVEHGKHWEGLAFLALTVLLYGLALLAERLPGALEGRSPRELVRWAVLGVAGFFLVMSVLDPVMQLGVQGLDWSTGLIVEVAFFVPAGLALLWVSRRLKPVSAA